MDSTKPRRQSVKCIVPGCSDYTCKRRRLPHPGLNPEKFITWIELAGRTDFFNEDPLRIYTWKRICQRHFSPGCFLPNCNNKKLKPDAMPDQFLPDNDAIPVPNTEVSTIPQLALPIVPRRAVPGRLCNNGGKYTTFVEKFRNLLNSKLDDPLPSISSDCGESSVAIPSSFVTSDIPKTFKRVNISLKNASVTTGVKTTLVGPSLSQTSKNGTQLINAAVVRGATAHEKTSSAKGPTSTLKRGGITVHEGATAVALPINTAVVRGAATHEKPTPAKGPASASKIGGTRTQEWPRTVTQPTNTAQENPKIEIGIQKEPSVKPSSTPDTANPSSDLKMKTPFIHYDDHAYLASPATPLVSDGVKHHEPTVREKLPLNAGQSPDKHVRHLPVKTLLLVGDEASPIPSSIPLLETSNLPDYDSESTGSDPGQAQPPVDIEEQIPNERYDNHPIMTVQTTKDTIQTYVDPLACVSTSMESSGISGSQTAGKPIPPVNLAPCETPLSALKTNNVKGNKIVGKSPIAPVNLAPCETPLSALKTHNVKVLGKDKKLSDPAVLSSLLNKVQLKKKGTVYVLPVDKRLDLRSMTKSQLQNLVRLNVSGSSKKPLLKLGKKKKPPRKRFKKKKWPTERNRCTCCVPCLRAGRRLSRFGILTKVEGNIFKEFPEFDLSQAENVFNVSTILTDIDDKSQVEQLCQLIIESVFKLRHVNMNRKMGSLTVIFANKSYGKYKRLNKKNKKANSKSSVTQPHDSVSTVQNTTLNLNEEVPENIDSDPKDPLSKNSINDIPATVVETEFGPCEIRLKTSDTNTPPLQNITSLSMNTTSTESTDKIPSKDQSHSSQEIKPPPKKPDYIVHLIDVDGYTMSPQKRNLYKRPFRTRDYRKLVKQVSTLQGLVKKKNDRLKLMYGKIDNLKKMLREAKGVKRLVLENKKSQAAPKTFEAENHNGSDAENIVADVFTNFPAAPPVKMKKPRRKRKPELFEDENSAAVFSITPEKKNKITPEKKKKSSPKENVEGRFVDAKSVKSHRKRLKTNVKNNRNAPKFTVSEVLAGQESYKKTPCQMSTEIVEDEEFKTYQDMYGYLIEEYSGESY